MKRSGRLLTGAVATAVAALATSLAACGGGAEPANIAEINKAFEKAHPKNDLLVPLVFLQDPGKRTVMVNAYSFIDPHTVRPTTLFPAALLGVLPLLVIFIFFQRQMVAGMSAGAVK
ncbi:hypothetical protein [Streptomyces sp. 3213.3]|uniref:hypothetical protein n=1 Tax=Streptomyces sp. 3213.3 TaxID=1855348 RepID=UPI000AD0A2A2|nr:hypothetical protein [Streptomyces sp. 3213.3]